MIDSQGMNLLMHAASQGKAKSIDVILRSVKNPGAFAMMKDSEGRTALMHAISHNHLKSIKAILSNVGNADELAFMKNKDDYNALMQAVLHGSYETITTLLDHVKNPIELIYSSSSNGRTALMLAAKDHYLPHYEPNVITAILENAKKIRDPYYRMSPKYKKGKNAYIFLDLDNLIYMKDSKGMNAFMFAMKNGIPHAILPFLILATDKLGLFDKKNNDQKNVLDFIDEELCNDLIRDLGSKKISMKLHDVDDVLSLLENHKASYSQRN
jgi:ankyrin repeat protein